MTLQEVIKTLTDYTTYALVAAFGCFFVLSIVVGIVQHLRKRELWDTSATGVLMLLWIVCATGMLGYAVAGRFGGLIVIPTFLFFGGAYGAGLLRALWKRIFGS
jgi:hypothetical protein